MTGAGAISSYMYRSYKFLQGKMALYKKSSGKIAINLMTTGTADEFCSSLVITGCKMLLSKLTLTTSVGISRLPLPHTLALMPREKKKHCMATVTFEPLTLSKFHLKSDHAV